MLVKQEQLSPCEVELEIQVDADKVKSALDETYAELGKRVNIPGFRKGKAPRPVLEQFLDREEIKDRAADKLIRGAYPEALEESKIEPFAPADVELVKMEIGEPMVFKAKVPLAPKVELGDYVGLDIERKVPEVKDEDVDNEIQRMLDRQAQYDQITDRAVQEGDVILIEMSDSTKPEQEPQRQVAEVGKNLPDFDRGVVGMQIDEEKTIEITYAEDHEDEDLRGKTIPFLVKLTEINEKKVPELTDEWVKATFVREPEEGAEPDPDPVDTVDKLKAKIREAMEKAAQDVANQSIRNQVVDKVVDNAEVCFPQVMVEEAVDDRLEGLLEDLKRRKVTLDDYLEYRKESIDDLRKRYAEESGEILKTSLVFREIMEKESIKVEDEDVNAEVESMAQEQGVPVATMNAYLDKTEGRSTLRNRAARKKVVEFLVHASNIKNVGGEEAAGESKIRKTRKPKSKE